MPQTLDYADLTTHPPPSRSLTFFASLTLGFPLIMLGLLYGQWMLSWFMLGHLPRPSMDDPKYIDGASWMHNLTGLALTVYPFAGCAALALNVLYLANPTIKAATRRNRVFVMLMLWLGSFLLLMADPARVLYWWLD